MAKTLVSTEPATGDENLVGQGRRRRRRSRCRARRLGRTGRRIRSPIRIEALRRFANVVRKRESEFADLIARETGKPMWEARTEVAAVINKVEISIDAYSERTPQRKLEAALGNKVAVRHKPHGVLAVLGPYNFPAHLPNGHIVPALIAGNAVVFKPSEKTPATGAFLVDCFHAAGSPRGRRPPADRRAGRRSRARRRARHRRPAVHRLGARRAALHRQFADAPHKILALELGGNNPLVVWDAKDLEAAATIVVQSAYLSAGQRCTAARRLIVEDGKEEPLLKVIERLIDRLIVDRTVRRSAAVHGPDDRHCRGRPSAGAMARA